jgi:photosystem II stability/assembly factor-like uncharacterized protein
MTMVDVIQWHGIYDVLPNSEFYGNYYYEYPTLIEEIKQTASAHGFNGEYWGTELTWSSEEFPAGHAPDQPWGQPKTDKEAAKYYTRAILMQLGMDVGVGVKTWEQPNTPWTYPTIQNLYTLMAGTTPTSLTVNIESEATNIMSYGFTLPNGDMLFTLWTNGEAVDDDRGISTTLTFPGLSGQKVVGIDVLNGFEQQLITSDEDSNLVIRGLLVKDYEIIVRFTGDSSRQPIWQNQVSGTDNNLISVDAVSEQIAWIGGLTGTVLRTNDGGNIWTDIWDQPDTLNIFNVEGLDENTALIAGVAGDWQKGTNIAYIYRTGDGGNSWKKVFEQANGWLSNITMFNQSEGVAIGDPVDNVWTILKTSDGGNTWETIVNPPSAIEGEWGTPYAISWLNDSTCWFGTNTSKAFHTIDRGKTWSAVAIPSYTSRMRLAFNQTGIGLASSAEAMLRTTDNGNSWQEMSPPDCGRILYILAHENIFWLLSDNAIYKSLDLGLSWKSLDLGLSWKSETSTETSLRHLSLITKDNDILGWAVGKNGVILYYREGIITDIKTEATKPDKFVLWQNYPNPFNPTTTIRYELPKTGKVVLTIYNLLGQEVKTLVNEIQTPGNKWITWHGRDNQGDVVGSGVYIYSIRTGSAIHARKMVRLP